MIQYRIRFNIDRPLSLEEQQMLMTYIEDWFDMGDGELYRNLDTLTIAEEATDAN